MPVLAVVATISLRIWLPCHCQVSMRVQKVVLCTDGNVVVFKTNILTIDLYFISLSQMPSVLLFFFLLNICNIHAARSVLSTVMNGIYWVHPGYSALYLRNIFACFSIGIIIFCS